MRRTYRSLKLLLFSPVIFTPLLGNSCHQKNNDNRYYAKPKISQNFIHAGNDLINLYQKYLVQQNALGDQITASPQTWLDFYNNKNSSLFSDAKLLANGYFYNYLTSFKTQLTSKVIKNAKSTWTQPQLTDFTNSFINFNQRFLFLLYSCATFLNYHFQTNKDKLSSIGNDVSNLSKKDNVSFITETLLIFANQNKEVANDNTTISSDALSNFLGQVSIFYLNDPKTDKTTNFLKLLLQEQWFNVVDFSFDALSFNPPSANTTKFFNYNFVLFTYRFTFALRISANSAGALSYSLDTFTVKSVNS